jgi:hypothetical protein
MPGGASADIGLHTPDTALTDATIDVSAGANQVTIALTHPARTRDRRTVWALLAELGAVALPGGKA